MTTTSVLALSDLSQPFIVECDALDYGIKVVLQQGGRLRAFFSKVLAARHHKLLAYEKESIRFTQVVRHWRPYLWRRHFVVRTDHYSLKFLLEYRVDTSPQQHWWSKLMGFDFTVEYRTGKENVIADVFSRQFENVGTIAVITEPQLDIFEDTKMEITSSTTLQKIKDRVQSGETGDV